MNYLEQLVSEYYEYRGFFVRKNIKVDLRKGKGGYNGELDVIAFHPEENKLVHVECSSDTDSKKTRDLKFERKFRIGRKFIPSLFKGLKIPEKIEQYAVLVYGSKKNYDTVGGIPFDTMNEFFIKIEKELEDKKFASKAVDENFPLLRTLQLYREKRCK